MAVLRWDPWGELAALQRDVSHLLNRSTAGPGAARTATGTLAPPLDAFSTEEGVVVRLDLPGLRPEDVDVSVQDGVLTVAGERAADTDVPEDAWLRRERPAGAFERSFTLPEGTEADKIAASFDFGVLELRIPHPPSQQPRRITVSTGSSANKQAVEVGS